MYLLDGNGFDATFEVIVDVRFSVFIFKDVEKSIVYP